MTQNDLAEASEFGLMQQLLTQVGMFFFSGAFWLLIDLIIKAYEESQKPNSSFEFSAWMFMCILSMIFGAALFFVGWRLSVVRQKKLKKYFPSDEDELN